VESTQIRKSGCGDLQLGSAGVSPAFTEAESTYTYSTTTGRLATVSNGSQSFGYTYEANSNLIASITGPAHTVTNTWDPTRNVMDKKENKVGTIEISTYDYSVNSIGQRTSVATSGTAFSGAAGWNWSYDAYGQVTLAEHGTNSSFHRSYAYDDIGNRLEGSAGVSPASVTTYTPNALNQYSTIENPQSTIINPIHDADGNMTSGPLPIDPESASALTWDAENRLISATVDSTSVTYTYDAQSRRIAKSVGSTTTLFVYDGWNPIAEYSTLDLQTFDLRRSYIWGMDLSGSMQGAGGVGGLLAVTIHDQPSSIYYPTFDGNGNVSEYLDDTGAIVAHYEYDPFGKIVVESGSQAADFAHRFSTKPVDSVTGLLYYGYRWYDPVTGRWPSRDPIGERGGINLYAFVRNNGINWIDYLGLDTDIPIVITASARASVSIKLDANCCERLIAAGFANSVEELEQWVERNNPLIVEYDHFENEEANIAFMQNLGFNLNEVNVPMRDLGALEEALDIESKAREGAINKLKNILNGDDPNQTLHFCIEQDGEINSRIIVPAAFSFNAPTA
jgi:RHS repeat-associated protein